MLIQMKEIKTKTYPLDKGFFLDIVTRCKKYKAWLYHKDYGNKYLMFEMLKEQQTYEQFLEIVELNAPDYIDYYKRNFME